MGHNKNLQAHGHNKYVFQANIYLFKLNNRNTRKRCDVIIVNIVLISHLFLLSLLLNLNMYLFAGLLEGLLKIG